MSSLREQDPVTHLNGPPPAGPPSRRSTESISLKNSGRIWDKLSDRSL